MEMTKKSRIRIWIVAVITGVMCFSDWSFAADTSDDVFTIMWYTLNYIISFLAWGWILFAKVAGIFLTNNWIYGETFWLDVLLWKYWNVMKNIANFWLWFYFVYAIFRWLINQWKEDITKKLKDIILWLLIAWIWIQTSRFLTATVIDASTITLVAAWAFPSQVISRSPTINDSIKQSLAPHFVDNSKDANRVRVITLFPGGKSSTLLKTEDIKAEGNGLDFDRVLDGLLPNDEDVGGPLYYMWLYILETYKVPSIKDTDKKARKFMILNTVIQWWATIVYSIEMAVLCILALMRTVYLWMFVVMSPVAVLLWCIEQSWQKLWSDSKSWITKFMDQINFKSFFINVFKPTIIVLWLSVTVLFVALMKFVVGDSGGRSVDLQGTVITSTDDWHKEDPWDNTHTTTMDNGFIRFTLAHTWKTFMEMIISMITVLMVYFILTVAVKMWDGKDFVSQKIWKVQDAVTWALGSIPLVPVAWYDKEGVSKTRYIWANNVFNVATWESELLNDMIARSERNVKEEYDRQDKIIRSWFGNESEYLTADDKSKIQNAWIGSFRWIQILEEKKKVIDGLKVDKWKWMKLNPDTADSFWIEEFGKRLENPNGRVSWTGINDTAWNGMITRWSNEENRKKGLKEMFEKVPGSVKAYADFFGLTLNLDDWEHLKDEDISKGTSTETK